MIQNHHIQFNQQGVVAVVVQVNHPLVQVNHPIIRTPFQVWLGMVLNQHAHKSKVSNECPLSVFSGLNWNPEMPVVIQILEPCNAEMWNPGNPLTRIPRLSILEPSNPQTLELSKPRTLKPMEPSNCKTT